MPYYIGSIIFRTGGGALSKKFSTPELYRYLDAAAESAKQQAMVGYGIIWEAYVKICAVLYDLVIQGAQDPSGEVSESASQRLSLTAGLLQSTALIEQTISCGYYPAAAALVRQYMEALARIIQIREGSVGTERRTPNVKVLPFQISKNYGRLSELTHVSNGELLGDFVGTDTNTEIAQPFPIYRKSWANDLLSNHISHLMTLAIEIGAVHGQIYPDKDLVDVNERLFVVARMLEQAGKLRDLNPIITLPHGAKGEGFKVSDLIEHIKKSHRDYIIQGGRNIILADHPKPNSLDVWLRTNCTRRKDTKQATNGVIKSIIETGLFVEGKFDCPDSGRRCKGIQLV